MSFIFANFINTTIAVSFSSTSTTLQVASSSGLPTLSAGQVLPIVLNDAATGSIYEIIYGTAITGSNITVLRAQEGTSAQNWSVGDIVMCAPTAGTVAPSTGVSNAFSVGAAATSSDAPQISQIQNSSTVFAADSGTVNAYAITLAPAPTAYADGMKVGFYTANTNTTTNPTLNINTLGAITITNPGGSALIAGQIPANTNLWLTYNSIGPRFELDTGIFAQANGNSANVFNVAPAANTTEAVTLGQAQTIYTAATTPLPTAGAAISIAHGLGVVPGRVRLILTCLTAEQGFSVGDEIEQNALWNGTTSYPLTVWKNSTNVGFAIQSGDYLVLFNKTTGIAVSATLANWSYRFALGAI